MTRGTAIIITNNNVVSTIEYNGDMYPEGHGDKFLTELREVKTKKDLRELQKKWIKTFGYKHVSGIKLYDYVYSDKALDIQMDWLTDNGRAERIKELIKEQRQIRNNFGISIIDLNISYYTYWFSDWVFIKNTTKKPFTIIMTDDNKTQYVINPNETIRLSFGGMPTDYDSETRESTDVPEQITQTLEEIEKSA